MDLKLIKNYKEISSKKPTLLCFPFAGGGASSYNRWVEKMNDVMTVCPIQLPGREERIMETPYDNMTELLNDLEEVMCYLLEGPYVLWGHSMGGKIAYEMEKRLEKKGMLAECLFVSGSRIPSIHEPEPIYHLPDEEFKKSLGRFEGTPKEILEKEELLDFFLPMLRADFTMDETYYDESITILHTPIVAFGGDRDHEADINAIKAWQKYTDNNFNYQIFEGGHFFIREHEELVISRLMEYLRRIVNAC